MPCKSNYLVLYLDPVKKFIKVCTKNIISDPSEISIISLSSFNVYSLHSDINNWSIYVRI